jgi:hypothetical protein
MLSWRISAFALGRRRYFDAGSGERVIASMAWTRRFASSAG